MTTRKYSSRSQQTTLSGALTSSGTSATVVSGSGLLGGVTISAGELFTVVIDPDTALEEIVDVSAVSTNTLTIIRGVDGSTGQAHSAGAVVRHMAIGRDYREANTHIEATTGHGATGAVVGTTNTQTLTNKTLTSPTITGTGAIAGTFTGNLTGNVTGNVSGNAGTVTNGVYTTDTGTVTSTMIANGTIVDADINSAAAITKTKISGTAITAADTGTVTSTMIADGTIVNADINSAAAIDKTKISGTAVTVADTGTVTSTMIADGTIVNADVNSSAQIAYSKTNLTNSIVDADVNASAAIAWTKIAPSSTVSATELGYLDGVTSAVQTQLDSKLATTTAASTYAPLASPALTGTPTAPTATAGTNTTQVATTAFVKTAVDNVVAAAPGALDTLNELATALGNDAAFSTTVTNSLATKLPLAGGTMSGAIAMGTNKITGMGTPTASTDAATKGYVDTAAIAPSNLTGPITSVGPATSVAAQTGTGSTFVMQASPTLTTPNIGVATATSVNGTTIPTSKTLVATDSTAYVVPSQTGNSGKYLTTDGSTSSWGAISGSLAQPTEPASPTDGLIWVDTDGTAPTTVVTRWSKAPTAGTTTLSGTDDGTTVLAYTPGYEQVFLNGVLLSRGSDYTATTGTSVVLSAATIAGDIAEVICPLQVAYTDAITTTAANAAYVPKTLTTTKGDIITATAASTPARLPVGTDAQILVADSSTSTGLAWTTPSSGMTNPMTTTGDTIYSSSGSTPARLGIGTTGQVLTVASGLPSWATPTSSGESYTLINSGGTSLSGTTTTVSGISGYENFIVIVAGAGFTTASKAANVRINGDTASNYSYAGFTLDSPASYAAGSMTEINADATSIRGGSTGSNTASLCSIAVRITGGKSSGYKSFTSVAGASTGGGNGQTSSSIQGIYKATASISSISVTSTATFNAGTIYVYGSTN